DTRFSVPLMRRPPRPTLLPYTTLFRSQHLDGWKNNNKNHTLIAEVEKRLEKETNAYLLFEEYLAPEIKEVLEASEQLKQQAPKKESKKKKSKNYDQQTMKKVERVKEDLKSSITKSNTELHRTL